MDIVSGMRELRLHGQNKPFIKYLLARITSFIEEQSGMGNNFVKYMQNPGGKPFEIEHIWSDHPERHLVDFNYPEDFKNYRNKIGDLVLLLNGTNQSFNDMNENEKIPHYIKENLLAASLCDELYVKNPNFYKFINSKNLNFKTYKDFDKVAIEERGVLYGKIAEMIWDL